MEKQVLDLLELLELPDGNFSAVDVPVGEVVQVAAYAYVNIYRFIFTI
jgi:hypothetical protein